MTDYTGKYLLYAIYGGAAVLYCILGPSSDGGWVYTRVLNKSGKLSDRTFTANVREQWNADKNTGDRVFDSPAQAQIFAALKGLDISYGEWRLWG